VTSASDNPLDLSGASRRWRPAPVIWLTLLLHAGAAVLLLAQPALWPWLLGAVACNHLLLSGAVLWPKGQLLGPNLTRLPASAAQRKEVALTFDDGPDPEVTPQVLDLLDRYQAKASFFCIGEKAAAYPDIVKDIVRRGHSVENHSYRHPHAFSFFGTKRLRHEVQTAQETITAVAGRAPLFFRAPAGFRSPMLDPVLARAGLHYASWTRRGLDGVKSDPAAVLRRLTTGLAAGDVLLLHDGAREPVVLTVLPVLLERLAEQGLKSVSLPMAFAVPGSGLC
jgi:peptidoglycan/xylan/chitin deacetylase (PgdA/CDA1 family)